MLKRVGEYKMSSYRKMKVADLRQLCQGRQIDFEGLTKPRLIQALQEYDQSHFEADNERDGDDIEPGSDCGEDDQPDVSDDDGGGSSISSQGQAADSESVAALKLQLALVKAQKEARLAEIQARQAEVEAKQAELEIERERVAIQANSLGMVNRTAPNTEVTNPGNLKLSLPTLNDSDALSFFHAFERTLQINDVGRSNWIKYLPSQLSQKALKAFTRLPLEQSRDYDTVKREILSYYKLDAHAYLKSFRTQHRTGNETYKMFLSKLSETFAYWQEAKEIDSLETLRDAIIADQFLTSLPDEVRKFVTARQPRNATECADLADLSYEVSLTVCNGKPVGKPQWANDHNQVNGRGKPYRGPFDQRGPPGNYRPPVNERPSNGPRHSSDFRPKQPNNSQYRQAPKFTAPYCVACGRHHHPNTACYNDKRHGVYATNCDNCDLDVANGFRGYIVPLFVNNVQVRALRDTGNGGPILIDKSLVHKSAYIPNTYIYCQGAFDAGIRRKLPVAEIKIRSPKFNYDGDITVRAAVCQMPAEIEVNIGNALFKQHPYLTDIIRLQDHRQDENDIPTLTADSQGRATTSGNDRDEQLAPATSGDDGDVQAVITRSDTRNDAERHQADEGGAVLTTDTDSSAETDTHDGNRPATDDELLTLTEMGLIDTTDNPDRPTSSQGETPPTDNAFQRAQRSDPSLACLWHRAETGSGDFRVIDNLLYKRAPETTCSDTDEWLLVVPTGYRQELLHIAHDLPSSGHPGSTRTKLKLRTSFYWPKMQKMVRQYVRSCKECQLTAPIRQRERAPLQPIDVIQTHAHNDITIDVMGGQLPRSAKGNKYVLMIICNTTKWPHAIPLKNLKSDTIAQKLVEYFCLYATIPAVIGCDNQTGFKSELLTKVRERLGIDAKFSAVWHSQSHGSVEHLNSTVESMIRKFIQNSERTWDDLLPLLMFALRQIPHSTTGLSPAQMVYGYRSRGLLDIAKETYTQGDPLKKQMKVSTLKYMEQLENKIQTALSAAQENVTAAQQRMKTNYDKVSSVRKLEPGDSVLILRPTTNDKLHARWFGPVTVIRKCENNNYELQIGRRKAIMHINQLRRFETTQADNGDSIVNTNLMVVDEISDDDWLASDTQRTTDNNQVDGATPAFNIGQQLSPEQQESMRRLLTDHSPVFSDTPGHTHLMQHEIIVTDNTPSYRNSYRIPEALREPVYNELMKMLDNRIIKYDDETRWNNPLIVLKKSDGRLRLVNDFTDLNKKMVDDKYQYTDAKELLSRVAGAKFISKVDLSSAFWQMDLTPESQPYTGFYTPFGTFSYIAMPQGIKTGSAGCQRLIDRILRGAHRYAASNLDDIIVFDENYDTHLKHVGNVLQRLQDAGLTANIKKCHFASNNIKILGHVVNDGLIYPDPDKIQVVQNWKPPKTKKQLRSFLGFTGFFRHYVRQYATISFPLTEMTAKNKPDKLVWTQTEIDAFEKLKQALISKPVLRAPDMSKDYKIFVDSSTVSLGCVIMQEDDSGKDYVIAYSSRKLLQRERRYPIVELELLAIVFALQKHQHLLFNKKFKSSATTAHYSGYDH